MGDVGDLIDHRDTKRFYPAELPRRYADALLNADGGIPSETVAHAAEILAPIASKCWGILHGNHETAIVKRYSRSVVAELAKELNLSDRLLGYWGHIVVRFRRKTSRAAGAQVVLKIDAGHGWQAGRRPGAKLNQLELELGYSDADIILRGHSHERIASVFPAWTSNGRLRPWPRVAAHTGTYKLGHVETAQCDHPHDTWEARRMFRRKVLPLLGPPRIVIRPKGSRPDEPQFAYTVLL
jgi:hypothetical protein